jgi:hypothetical protein
MKKNIIIVTFILGLLSFMGCEKDEVKVYISDNPVAPALQSPASPDGMAFTKEDANNKINYVWSAADFGYKASITYGVEIDKTESFTKPATLFTSDTLTGSAKVSDINSMLLGMDLEVGVATTINCRVWAMVSPNADTAYSAITNYTVTPYETLIDYPMHYVPGEYQGWSPGDVNGRLFSYKFDNIYENIIRLTDSDADGKVQFKVTPAPNWDNAWGGTLTDGSGTLDPAGDNFQADPGTYAFKVDVSALTIDLTATDDWGIIGSSVPPYDWSADVDMFYNGQRQMWEITDDFKAGVIKFRANDGWDLNYGSNNADGNLDAGGSDIPLAADGNYTIRMDVANLTYQITKN